MNSKYQSGVRYSNGVREVVFRYNVGNTFYFTENGERKKMNRTNFYKLKLKPLDEISTGRVKAGNKMPKDYYKKTNSQFYAEKD